MEVGKHWLCGGNTKQCGGKASGPRIMGGPKCSAWEFLFHLPSNKMTTLELCSGKINISTMGQKRGPLALLNSLHKFFCVCHSVTACLSMHNIKKFTRENSVKGNNIFACLWKGKGSYLGDRISAEKYRELWFKNSVMIFLVTDPTSFNSGLPHAMKASMITEMLCICAV